MGGRLLEPRHGAAEPWLLQPVERKLVRKSDPWPLNDGGAAFDLAVACCLANVSCWRKAAGRPRPISRPIVAIPICCKAIPLAADGTRVDAARQPPFFCRPDVAANACSRCRRILAEAWLRSPAAIASIIATCSRHQSWTRRLLK